MSGPAVIDVPPSQPDPVREPEGDPGQADALATTLFRVAGRYADFAEEAAQLQGLGGGWYGPAYDAYLGAASRASGEHDTMATTVRRVAQAVSSYADNLREHRRTWEDQVDTRAAIDRDRDQLLEDIRAAQDVDESVIAQLRSRASGLRVRYDQLVTAHDELHRRVRADEDALRQAFTSATSLEGALSGDAAVPDAAVTAMGKPGAPGDGASPEQVAQWWEGLSEAERAAVVAAYPDRIGSADGLPASARDDANRILLAGDLAALEAKEEDGTITDEERQVLENARRTQEALENAEDYTDPITGEKPGSQLWLYDPRAFDGDGRVAVSVGDIDTADDVSVQVPGIKTEMSDVVGYTEEAMHLHESARYGGDGSSVATMFWLGYNTPEGAVDWDTLTTGRAEDGGERLADAVSGMRASRDDDPANMTVIGHSYGSTTTSYAATDHDLDVDRIALIGSPGAGPAMHASEFSVGQDNVYVGRNSSDAVAFFGHEGWGSPKGAAGLGRDPSSEDFDANRFEAESTTRSTFRSFDDHSKYYDQDTESLYNLGRIVDGDTDAVNGAAQSYDPWWRVAEDPEDDRTPTENLPGRSDTTGRN